MRLSSFKLRGVKTTTKNIMSITEKVKFIRTDEEIKTVKEREEYKEKKVEMPCGSRDGV